MKTTTKVIIGTILTFVSLYAAMSFCYMDINCIHWDGTGKKHNIEDEKN